MGYGNMERDIDRRLAAEKRANPKTLLVSNRSQMQAIAIYMQPIIATETTKLHCFFCGHPFIEVRNNILYISPFSPSTANRVTADTINCKRCKQRYIKLV